jgi:hypothetical protein
MLKFLSIKRGEESHNKLPIYGMNYALCQSAEPVVHAQRQKSAQHLNEHIHSFGPTDELMQTVHQKKRPTP